MAGKNTAAFGIFKSRVQAERCIDTLLASGYRNDDISVLAPDQATTHEFATEKNTKAPEGVTTGAATGGAVGGTLGLLAGIGALAIPGLGPFIAAGPIMGALAGAGAGAVAGGLVGALVGMGIPEFEAKRYEATSKMVESSSPSIATTPTGLRKRRIFWSAAAPPMYPPPVKRQPVRTASIPPQLLASAANRATAIS